MMRCKFKFEPNGSMAEDMFHWQETIIGPADSPYAAALDFLSLQISEKIQASRVSEEKNIGPNDRVIHVCCFTKDNSVPKRMYYWLTDQISSAMRQSSTST